MAPRKTVTNDRKTQHQRFVEAAKELGADEDADAFRRAVRQIATARPMPKPKAAKKPKR